MPLRVSRTITRQVMEQGLAILGADVPGSGGLSGVESLVTLQVRSLLCVPLTVFQKVIGCIYVDTTSPAVRFDQDHLELVASIAGISAVALENARRLHWLEQENLRLAAEINLQHNMVGESNRMQGCVPVSVASGPYRFHRPGVWRERNRKGTGGAGHSSQQPAGGQTICRH